MNFNSKTVTANREGSGRNFCGHIVDTVEALTKHRTQQPLQSGSKNAPNNNFLQGRVHQTQAGQV